MKMSKFILTAFGDEIGDDLDLQMDVLEAHGIKYIEFRAADGKGVADYTLEEARKLKERLDARGFKISAIGSPIGKIYITEDFEPHLAKFKHVMEIAKILETRYIRLFSFFIPEGEDPAAYRDEVMKRMAAFVEAAKGSGLILLHENEKHIYGDIPERCRDIFNTIQSDILWGIYDPSNFVQCHVKNYPHAFNMLKDRIVYMHIKDSVYSNEKAVLDKGFDTVSDKHRPAGYGDGNLEEIVRELHRAGFEGFFSIEPHLSNNDAIPGGGPEKFAVACNAIKELIARVTEN